MRRAAGLIGLCLATAAMAGPANAKEGPQGIQGEVLNATCPGPCSIDDPPPRRYQGEAEVRIRTLPERELVASVMPKGGAFEVSLPTGRYRVKVRIEDPMWSEDKDRVRVRRDELSHVSLTVSNTGVL